MSSFIIVLLYILGAFVFFGALRYLDYKFSPVLGIRATMLYACLWPASLTLIAAIAIAVALDSIAETVATSSIVTALDSAIKTMAERNKDESSN